MHKGKSETEIDPELKRWQMLEIPVTPEEPEVPKAPNNTPEESFLIKYKNVVEENILLKKKVRYSIDTIETLEKKVLFYENLYLKEHIKYLVLESQIESSCDSSDSSMNSFEN